MILHLPQMSSLRMCHLLFFIEDVLSSPPVEPSSSADSPSEQLIRCSHHLRQPLTITLIILSQSLLLLSQLLIEMLFFI
jgi:hypothetical protein